MMHCFRLCFLGNRPWNRALRARVLWGAAPDGEERRVSGQREAEDRVTLKAAAGPDFHPSTNRPDPA